MMNLNGNLYILLLFTCLFTIGHLAPLAPKELRSNHPGSYDDDYEYDATWEYDPEAAFKYHYIDQLDGYGDTNDLDGGGSDYISAEIENYFTCVESGYYIHSDLICDGFNDCVDGSDESQQLCGGVFSPPRDDIMKSPSTTTTTEQTITTTTAMMASDDYDYEHCTPQEFACTSLPGLCLSKSSMCDGVADCPEGEDEKLDNCKGVLEAKGKQSTVDIIHPELTILQPAVQFEIVHPVTEDEFDILKVGDTLASTSKLKFATSGGHHEEGSNTRMTGAGNKHSSNNKAPSPYKLLYKIFEQSPLKKKLKVLNRLQRLALQSNGEHILDVTNIAAADEKSERRKQFQTLLKRLSKNASALMEIEDLNINININIEESLTTPSS